MSIARDIADDINVGNVGLPLKDSNNADVLAEDINGVVTLTADEANVGSNALVVDSSGNVGIGTSPSTKLEVSGISSLGVNENDYISARGGNGTARVEAIGTNANVNLSLSTKGSGLFYFWSGGYGGTERMRIDSSGNLLVGTTDTFAHVSSSTGEGVSVSGQYNVIYVSRSGGELMQLNRQTSDGELVRFRKDGTTVGSISAKSGRLAVHSTATDAGGFRFTDAGGKALNIPCDNSGANTDVACDLGYSSARFDNIYAFNDMIQTSDQNEKQDIEELSEAEQRVAVAAKSLMRKFRWKSAVAKKGDEARIHFGIIAQDLQAAFEAEGLDAGRYAMFISSTWWETSETYTDDEGIEQTRTNTYYTAEEAPEGAVESTRLGVRYSELLAFIIAAI